MHLTCNNNNNNNTHILPIVPYGHNFRGSGARQCAAEKRKERKLQRRGMSLAYT